ncbi:MAG TPA: NAD-dependent epimerase/dehydratase family protein, partial [Verrucomicrobiae bacterium]
MNPAQKQFSLNGAASRKQIPISNLQGRVLVTGGSGFIGTNLMELLPQRFAAVMNLDLTPPLMAAQNQYWKQADIMDPAGLVEAFRAFAPSHVIHLAARCDCDENTTVEKGYRVNTEGTANVLAAIKAVPDIQRAVI